MYTRYLVGAICFFISCGFQVAVAVDLDPAQKMGLLPHRALYEIRLATKKSSAKITDIYGKIFYEWQPSCDAWISKQRVDITYEYIERSALRITSDFSTAESFDGQHFNFALQRKHNDMMFEERRGYAQIDENGGLGGHVLYTVPKDLVFDLPQGTLFPMAHTLAVLRHIKSGDKIYHATLFDGSDVDGSVNVNSFIVGKALYDRSSVDGFDFEKGGIPAQTWHLRLAFFSPDHVTERAEYEMSLFFHENGVISDMNIEYDDFSVTQKLIAFESLKGGEGCSSDVDNVVKEN